MNAFGKSLVTTVSNLGDILAKFLNIGKPEDAGEEAESVPQLSSCLKSYFTFESYVNSLKWVCFFRTTFLSRRITHSHVPVKP